MRVEDVELQRTPRPYFCWLASTPDGDVRTRGPTPAIALYRMHAALEADVDGDLDVDEELDAHGELDVEPKPSI